MTSTVSEQDALLLLSRTLAKIDPLLQRMSSRDEAPKAAEGTELAADDQRSHPFRVSHFAASALMSACDHLEAWRALIQGCTECSPDHMNFVVTGHWALLRGALENGSRAIWLLGPDDSDERVMRALRMHADNVKQSDAAAALLGSSPGKTKAERLEKVKDIATQAGLAPKEVVNIIRYGEIARYASDRVIRNADRGEFFWRACSGAAHGDTWAVLSLQDQGPAESADGVSTVALTASITALTVVTVHAARIVEAAFRLFDDRNAPIP